MTGRVLTAIAQFIGVVLVGYGTGSFWAAVGVALITVRITSND